MMTKKIEFLNCPPELEDKKEKIISEAEIFVDKFSILEKNKFYILLDQRTNAFFSECHISAKDLINHGTIDVPLDPDNQPDYRANREVIEEHSAYLKMIDDANKKRLFSNIVCEYNTTYQPDKPIKVIGGQHRFLAIEDALKKNINEFHGVKIYFNVDKNQRLDVQLISNTNIAVSSDLLDRMFETAKGPELRNWCQAFGLLPEKEDFTDKKQRGSQISVRGARTFIINYFKGKNIDDKSFDKNDTTPIISKTGIVDDEWEKLRERTDIWNDKGLLEAGKKFSRLASEQKNYFKTKRKEQFEYAEKALSYSVIASWAFIAGILQNNKIRLKRHFDLAEVKDQDPLAANLLAKAKHKSDPENYRGLGTRTDVKDRGRLAELFFLQAEKGDGFTKSMIDLAIKKYHAKQSNLEVIEAEKKLLNE